jgi:hypothetical protein
MSTTNQTNFDASTSNVGVVATSVLATRPLNETDDQTAQEYEVFRRPILPQIFSTEAARYEPSQASSSSTSNTLPAAIRDNWLSLARSGLQPATMNKLIRLARKQDGWKGAGSVGLKTGALRSFLSFWRAISDEAREPFLTVTPAGNLYAEWHASWRRHLDIEFVGNGEVFFGLFHTDEILEGRSRTKPLEELLKSRRGTPLLWGDG